MTIKAIYARATSVITAVIILVVGMTYAAVNTQASLLGSTISTTATDLLVWDGTNYSNSAPGFTATDILPGVGSPEYLVSFKNTGGNPLALGMRVPTTLKFSGFNSTSASTAMKYVKVTIKNNKTGDKLDTTLYALTLSTDVSLPWQLAGGASGNPNDTNGAGNFSIKFDIDPAGLGSAKATIDAFDIVFTGKPIAAS